jgi:hypothetical protein
MEQTQYVSQTSFGGHNYPYGTKQVCKVLRNSPFKMSRVVGTNFCDQRMGQDTNINNTNQSVPLVQNVIIILTNQNYWYKMLL